MEFEKTLYAPGTGCLKSESKIEKQELSCDIRYCTARKTKVKVFNQMQLQYIFCCGALILYCALTFCSGINCYTARGLVHTSCGSTYVGSLPESSNVVYSSEPSMPSKISQKSLITITAFKGTVWWKQFLPFFQKIG